MPQDADPVFTGPKFADVADIEVGANPRAVDLVEVVAHQFRRFTESVPYVFDQNPDSEFAGGRKRKANLLDRPLPHVVMRLLIARNFARDQQNGVAAERLGVFQRLRQVPPSRFAGFIVRVG